MANRFIGRWADRTASRRLCRPYRVLFCCVPLAALAVFIVFQTSPDAIDRAFATLPTKVITALRIFDAIVLPRSIRELDAIGERLGTSYFRITLLSETLLAIAGAYAVSRTLRHVNTSEVDDEFSHAQLIIRAVIVSYFLAVRSPDFSYVSTKSDYIDKAGFYLIRESILISAGYYNLALLLVDAVGRLARMFLKFDSEQQSGVRDLLVERKR